MYTLDRLDPNANLCFRCAFRTSMPFLSALIWLFFSVCLSAFFLFIFFNSKLNNSKIILYKIQFRWILKIELLKNKGPLLFIPNTKKRIQKRLYLNLYMQQQKKPNPTWPATLVVRQPNWSDSALFVWIKDISLN